MRDQTWSNLVVVLAAVVTVTTVCALAVVAPPVPMPARGTNVPAAPTVFYNLSIARGASGDYEYNQTQLSVPANTLVVFTITNHDPAVSMLPSPTDANVVGTTGGTMTVASGSTRTTVSGVSTTDVSHTFTMSDAYYHLNVPIPPASASGIPTHVTFSVVFHFIGKNFAWGCVAYCGGSLMPGMYGAMSVR